MASLLESVMFKTAEMANTALNRSTTSIPQ